LVVLQTFSKRFPIREKEVLKEEKL